MKIQYQGLMCFYCVSAAITQPFLKIMSICCLKKYISWSWWYTPLIPQLRGGQALCGPHTVSPKTTRVTRWDPTYKKSKGSRIALWKGLNSIPRNNNTHTHQISYTERVCVTSSPLFYCAACEPDEPVRPRGLYQARNQGFLPNNHLTRELVQVLSYPWRQLWVTQVCEEEPQNLLVLLGSCQSWKQTLGNTTELLGKTLV